MELKHIIELVSAGVVVFLVWSFSGALDAYFDFKTMPKEPMEWCHVHGAFSRKHVMPIMNTTVCPVCFKEAWDKAGK